MIGKTILHYKILEKLGEGGMGVVYLAEDTKLERKVAIKFLPNHIAGNSEERKRFEIEAKAAAALNHANIATIYNIEKSDDDLFIVMEFIKGKELKEKIKEEKWDIKRVVDVAAQIAKALQAAHEQNIVHRDIKSTNIMVTDKGDVKIMDFGLAKFRGSAQITQKGTTVGTAAYMSPEQAKGEEADQKADIWSFGVVLFEMLTGQLPFKGDYDQAMMYAILNEQPQPVQSLVPDIPSALIHILDRTLEKDSTLRYQSISEVLIELKRLQSSGSHTAVSNASQPAIRPSSTGKSTDRSKVLLPSVLILVVITIIAAIFLLKPFASSESREPMKIVPFTTLPGVEMQPAISPTGNEIAFAWNGGKGENFDIYVQIIGTFEPQKLTDDPGFDACPVWTPDGRSILFSRFTSADANSIDGPISEILIPARGGTEKVLNKRRHSYPPRMSNIYSFTKTGDAYVSWIFADKFKLSTFSSIAFNTAPLDTITEPPPDCLGDHGLQFSPDGTKLAFMRQLAESNEELHVMAYPQGTPYKVTEFELETEGMSWLPDGEEIIVAGGGQLFRVSVTEGTRQQMAITSGLDVSQPFVSPDGHLLAFRQNSKRWPDLFRLDIGQSAGKNAQAKAVVSSSLDDSNGKISPDGNRIIFTSNRTGKRQIWISNIDGTNANPVADIPGSNPYHPAWSPDGAFIIYEGLNIISAAGGKPETIETIAHIFPRFSADGKWIYFSSNHSGSNEIWKIPRKGGNPVQVTKNGGEAAYESADGQWVYYSRFWTPEKNGLFRIPVKGGEEQPVIDKAIHRRAWVLTDNGIYYYLVNLGTLGLYFCDLSGEKRTKIAEFDLHTTDGYFDISPDGSWLLFAQREAPESDIMLIENFR